MNKQINAIEKSTLGFFQEFKAFIAKGNVVDLAVGVIIGSAFGKIVESMVKDIITPAIGLIGGQPDFSGIAIGAKTITRNGKEVLEGGIMIGNFINAAISFLILAFVVFFFIVKPMNRLVHSMRNDPAPGPKPATLDDVVKAIRELQNNNDRNKSL